jgi:integrase
MEVFMRGYITKRAKDSYTIVLNLGNDPVTGKRKQQWISIKGTKKDAEKKLSELLNQIDNGIFIKPGKQTLSDYLNHWLEDNVKPNLSPRTYELYSYMCRNHIVPAIGNVPLSDIKPVHLQHLYANKQQSGLSNRTVQLIHITIHKALKNAVKIGLLNRNAAESVDIPKIQRHEMHTMDENDIQKFLEAAKDTDYYTLFFTCIFTGMRRSELLALRWQDVDLLLCQISVTRTVQQLTNTTPEGRITFKEPKTQKSRRLIALTPANAVILREHRSKQEKQRLSLGLPTISDNDLVFSHHDGSPLRPDSITHIWKKLIKRCGLKDIRLHDARHTHASLLLKQGIHPKIVQERLGHSGIAITLDLYSHVTPSLQQMAAAKFDEIAIPKESGLEKELKELSR